MLKFFAGGAILVLALFLQVLFASTGLHFTFTLAILIAFAFAFDFWELLVFDLLAVFILNWQPGVSFTLFIFALIPLVAFTFRHFVRSEPFIGNLIAIFIGFSIFYFAAAPLLFIHKLPAFFLDLIIGFGVGELVLFGLT